tara:strand:- start:324 stop:431 length:108 start_codon:yes stop_codon:yes gene_type:complete
MALKESRQRPQEPAVRTQKIDPNAEQFEEIFIVFY